MFVELFSIPALRRVVSISEEVHVDAGAADVFLDFLPNYVVTKELMPEGAVGDRERVVILEVLVVVFWVV